MRVAEGILSDGVGQSCAHRINARGTATINDVVAELWRTATAVMVNFLPVGSQRASELYAEAALRAGCAFVNCMPSAIARSAEWAGKFADARIPLIGDDLKSQFGATLIHHTLMDVLYEHVTDLGVLQHVFQSRFQRTVGPDDIVRFAGRFVGLLDERYASSGDSFGEIPGATSLLTSLTEHSEWRVAIATGSLQASAKFKMRKARLPADNVPAAFAEDGPSREAIVRAAVERAKEQYGVGHFNRIVSVSDAVWDVRTARRLELPFVGVAAGQRAASLLNNGAMTVIEDFMNYDHCMKCFERAAIPAKVPARS